MADTCDLPPFRYQSVPQTDPVTGASSNQVNEQSLEEWLASLLTRVCDDLQAIEARLDSIEDRLDALDGG